MASYLVGQPISRFDLFIKLAPMPLQLDPAAALSATFRHRKTIQATPASSFLGDRLYNQPNLSKKRQRVHNFDVEPPNIAASTSQIERNNVSQATKRKSI
jgi:hypothetical protein